MRIRVAQAIGFQSEPESEPIIGTRAISSGRLRHSPRRHTHANRATRGPQTRRQTQPPQQVVAISCLRQRPLGALSPHPPPSLGALRRNRSQLRLPSSVSYLTNHSFPSFHHRLLFRFCPNWKLQDLICSELATWLAPACLCPPWTPPSVRCYRRFVFTTFLFCLFVIFEDSFAFLCLVLWFFFFFRGFWLLQIRLEQRLFSFWAIRDLSGDVLRFLISVWGQSLELKCFVCWSTVILFLFFVQEFGNVETPMYTRLRHFFGTIYNRCVCVCWAFCFLLVEEFSTSDLSFMLCLLEKRKSVEWK